MNNILNLFLVRFDLEMQIGGVISHFRDTDSNKYNLKMNYGIEHARNLDIFLAKTNFFFEGEKLLDNPYLRKSKYLVLTLILNHFAAQLWKSMNEEEYNGFFRNLYFQITDRNYSNIISPKINRILYIIMKYKIDLSTINGLDLFLIRLVKEGFVQDTLRYSIINLTENYERYKVLYEELNDELKKNLLINYKEEISFQS